MGFIVIFCSTLYYYPWVTIIGFSKGLKTAKGVFLLKTVLTIAGAILGDKDGIFSGCGVIISLVRNLTVVLIGFFFGADWLLLALL